MNQRLKAVVLEVSGGNVRNNHIYLRGLFGLFPDDCLGGSKRASAGKPIELRIGGDVVTTDIDETKGIFRERGAIGRFFEKERVAEGDLIVIERLAKRSYRVSKTAKRILRYYL